MKILRNPWLIFLALSGGILLGIFANDTILNIISPVGDVYIRLLEMSVVPIVIFAIVSSIAQMAGSPALGRKVVFQLLKWLVITIGVMSLFAMLMGRVLQPGNLNAEQQTQLGTVIQSSPFRTDLGIRLNLDAASALEEEQQGSVLNRFFLYLVPSNIFSSLANGDILQIVFFGILFGVAIAFIDQRQSKYLISLSTSLFVSFQKIIEWAMYLLPIGLLGLVAKQVSSAGVAPLLASTKLIFSFYGIGLSLLLCNTLIVMLKSKASFRKVFSSLLNPSIVAFSTRSSVAAIPSGLEALSENLRFDRTLVKLLYPLCITIARFGNVVFFTLAAVFSAQIYNIPIGPLQMLLVVVASIVAGVATAGSTGFATLGMLTLVLDVLGLPGEAILLVFYAIDPIIDPMRTLLIVHANLMLTALIVPLNTHKRADVQQMDEFEEIDSTEEGVLVAK